MDCRMKLVEHIPGVKRVYRNRFGLEKTIKRVEGVKLNFDNKPKNLSRDLAYRLKKTSKPCYKSALEIIKGTKPIMQPISFLQIEKSFNNIILNSFLHGKDAPSRIPYILARVEDCLSSRVECIKKMQNEMSNKFKKCGRL